MTVRNFIADFCLMRNLKPIAVITVVVLTTGLFTSAEDQEDIFHDTRQGEFVRALASYEISIPTRVQADGEHLSRVVYHRLRPDARRRKRRSTAELEMEEDTGSDVTGSVVYYKVMVDGAELHLELVPNDVLFAPGLVVERRRKRSSPGRGKRAAWHGDARAERITHNRCHFRGKVRGHPKSKVAIATCNGLHGYIHTGEKDYFIEPIKSYNQSTFVGHPHLIYRRSALPPQLLPSKTDTHSTTKRDSASCGVTGDQTLDGDREQIVEADSKTGRSRRRKRSISLERNVETLVVVDRNMMEFHQDDNIENYVLTIMNMVSTMFHDATIGNAVNIVLVRIIYLEQDEKELVIQTHADHTLSSFCKWQSSINQKDDKHPNHHDVAILLTRLDICSRSSEPCSTLGLSQVSGMCQHHRSCNINQDTGLALAFTVTHELGHNFGMQHDSTDNGCEPRVTTGLQYIMAPQLTAEASPLVWSNCSRKAITAFLDRDWGYCLEDAPSDHDFEFPVLPPGVMYDIDHQCRLQYGPDAEYCDGIDDLCTAVWCRVDNKCLTRLEAAAEGTLCGDNEWCFGGRCIAIGEKPLAIDSHWGEWGAWSECTRTCGAGVSQSERLCNNPPPSHGGRYCLGERKRFRICNTKSCPEKSPSFREFQCSEFSNVSYKGQKYEWEPVASSTSPCQLHCKPKARYFSVMLKDMVTDGTPCRAGRRDMCISGRCRVVGCDWGIESDAVEDGCGICHGDGSTCTKVTESFDEKLGLGYVEAIVIPEGARNIRVEEVAEANNYLAIRNDKGDYYLNGGWFIQWSGDYEVAGTVVEYRREGNKESLFTRGPITEPLHLMLLFQSQNPGIKLEYTVVNENATERRRPEFLWKFSDWTHCTVSCGGGSQTSQVICVEKEAGVVEDRFCNASSKPDDMHKSCNDHQCPARWWSGPWQHCSVTCGENGYHRRTVLCVRQRGPDEQIALEDWECDGLQKPPESSKCKHKEPCPVEESPWKIGPWSEVCRDDPCGIQRRTVECLSSLGDCDSSTKPPMERSCPHALCGQWKTMEWSPCTRTCGTGTQFRSVICVGGRACPRQSEPKVEQECNVQACTALNVTVPTEHDVTRSSTEKRSNTSAAVVRSQDASISNLPKTDDAQSPDHHWVSLFWSECSKLCGEGYRTRSVVCMHVQTKLTVENASCADQQKPVDRERCEREPCITWTLTAWLPCSVTCGEGLQLRMVSCAVPGRCDLEEKPADKKICSAGPCIYWVTGSWQECSETCGSGTRLRSVTCVDGTTKEEISGCDTATRPSAVQSCNIAECPSNSDVAHGDQVETCSRNIFNDGMCDLLRKQGKCPLSYVQRKCCKTCQWSTLVSGPEASRPEASRPEASRPEASRPEATS